MDCCIGEWLYHGTCYIECVSKTVLLPRFLPGSPLRALASVIKTNPPTIAASEDLVKEHVLIFRITLLLKTTLAPIDCTEQILYMKSLL